VLLLVETVRLYAEADAEVDNEGTACIIALALTLAHLFLSFPVSILILPTSFLRPSSFTMSKPEFTLRTGIYPAIEPDLFKGSLAGKVALVTGSGRGIGREIALALAKSGAAVAISGRTKAQVEETTKDVLNLGGGVRAIGVVGDICDRTELDRLVKEVYPFLLSLPCSKLLRLLKVLGPSTFSSVMQEQIHLCHSI
jgi:hypothetical protein